MQGGGRRRQTLGTSGGPPLPIARIAALVSLGQGDVLPRGGVMMRLPILMVMILLSHGCSDAASSRDKRTAHGRPRPAAAEDQLRLEDTSVRVWKEGSRVSFAVSNRTPADLCIARHEWIGETQEAARVYDAQGREFAYRGELSRVTDDPRPPIRVPSGWTLRVREDLSKSYAVEDWSTATVVYAPVVSLCRARPSTSPEHATPTLPQERHR